MDTIKKRDFLFPEKSEALLSANSLINRQFDNLRDNPKMRLFLALNSRMELNKFTGLSPSDFNHILHSPIYKESKIRKRNGSQRILEIPEQRLKRIQRKLNNYMQLIYNFLRPRSAHGFVRHHGKYRNNILRNARPHVARSVVLTLDLKDFFHSVTAHHVQKVFMNSPFNFNTAISQDLTKLFTYKNHLPQGAPTSPVLSNLVSLRLDHKLQTLGSHYQINYTRYADDLTFSSFGAFPSKFSAQVKEIIEEEGFVINARKTRIRSVNRQQKVTGIIVNKRLNVDRKYIRRVRAILHDVKCNGIQTATSRHFRLFSTPTKKQEVYFVQKLGGMVSFIGQIRGAKDPLFHKIYCAYASLFPK